MDNRRSRFFVSTPGAAVEYSIADFEVGEVRLSSKIRRYALSLESRVALEADVSDHSRIVLDLWADLVVHDTHRSPRPLGRATMKEPIFYEAPRPGTPQRPLGDQRVRVTNLTIDLTLDQMDEIEELRDGRDLVLGVSLGGVVHLGGELHGLYSRNHQLTVTAPQSQWAQAIQGVDYARILTVELRVPHPASSGGVSQAIRSLEKARAAYSRGDYEEAVADCREGCAILVRSGDDRFDIKGKSRNAGKEERFWRVRRALLEVTHLAHHPEDADPDLSDADEGEERVAPMEWRRADAHSVIVMLAALITGKVGGA